MAITTLDGLVAGYQQPRPFFKVGATMEAAGVMYTPQYVSGMPGASVANGAALAGSALTTYSGQIPYTNPSSGNGYLARIAVAATSGGTLLVVDRLWHNDSIAETTTTAQTITSAAWPARDRDGATDGVDVMVGIEVSAATTNGSAVTNTTMSYTNSDGTSGRTATIASFPATALAGTFVPFQLQAGDVGVRSIESLTLGTSYGGGTIHLVAYRVLSGPILVPLGGAGANFDFTRTGLVRCYDNTVPQLIWIPQATTAVTFMGALQWAHG